MEMSPQIKRRGEKLPLSLSSNADEFNLKFYFSSSASRDPSRRRFPSCHSRASDLRFFSATSRGESRGKTSCSRMTREAPCPLGKAFRMAASEKKLTYLTKDFRAHIWVRPYCDKKCPTRILKAVIRARHKFIQKSS